MQSAKQRMNRITEEQLLEMIYSDDMEIGLNMDYGSDSEFGSSDDGVDKDSSVDALLDGNFDDGDGGGDVGMVAASVSAASDNENEAHSDLDDVWDGLVESSNSDESDGDIVGPHAQGRGMTGRHDTGGGGTSTGTSRRRGTGRGRGTGRRQDTSNDYNWTSISTGR